MHLPQLILPEILETLCVLGIEVSDNSFSIKTEEPSSESAVSHEERVNEELEDINESDASNVKEKTKDVVKAFEGITVESIWSSSHEEKSVPKLKEVEVRIPKLNLQEGHCEEKYAFSCVYPACELVFDSKDFLKLHMESQYSSEKSLFSKDHGGKPVFVNKGSMMAHTESGHTETFDCEFKDCNKTFTLKGSLTRHINGVHRKEKPYQCSQCLKKFDRNSNLTVHVKTVHQRQKSYQCNLCLKKFSQSGPLTLHIRNMHNKEKPHACPQPGCAEMFKLKPSLRTHMINVHNHEKPYRPYYPCIEQNCDKKFLDRRTLKDHLRKDHGAAKLVCGFENCAATFTIHKSLWLHKKEYNHTDK